MDKFNKRLKKISGKKKRLPKQEEKKPVGFSFCITCKGRLEHLKQTLPHNLKMTEKYCPNYEFTIVNYNSEDDMHEWIMGNYSKKIKSGLIKYRYTTEPKYFHMSHAKNMAHNLGTKDILFNLDADNFISKTFCDHIISIFPDASYVWRSCKSGRIAVPRKVYYDIGGYDEKFMGWGLEDGDFVVRAVRYGLRYVEDWNKVFKWRIEHGDKATNYTISQSKSMDYNTRIYNYNNRHKIVRVNEDGFGVESAIKELDNRNRDDVVLLDSILASAQPLGLKYFGYKLIQSRIKEFLY